MSGYRNLAIIKDFQGPQGATGGDGSGPTGVQGVTGTQGGTGAQGGDGSNGLTGPQGALGATGLRGSQGLTGPQGTDGTIGNQGETGAQGNTGEAGADGTAGTPGTPGTDGADGAAGPRGWQGDDGSGGVSTGYIWYKSSLGAVSLAVTSSAFPVPMDSSEINFPGGTINSGGVLDHTTDINGTVFQNNTGTNGLFRMTQAIACSSGETETFVFHVRPGNSSNYHTICQTVLLSASLAHTDTDATTRKGAAFSFTGRINSNNSNQFFWASNGSVTVQQYSYGFYYLGTA